MKCIYTVLLHTFPLICQMMCNGIIIRHSQGALTEIQRGISVPPQHIVSVIDAEKKGIFLKYIWIWCRGV